MDHYDFKRATFTGGRNTIDLYAEGNTWHENTHFK